MTTPFAAPSCSKTLHGLRRWARSGCASLLMMSTLTLPHGSFADSPTPPLRQHLPADRYQDWTSCFPLFRPINAFEQAALEKGEAAFREIYPTFRLFPDPFLDTTRRPPDAPLSALRISAPDGSIYRSVAEKLASEIESRWGIKVPVISDEAPDQLVRSSGPLLILGGTDRNRAAMAIAKTYQIGLFNATCPGAGGWGVATHGELEAGMAPRYLLACDEATADAAIHAFLADAVQTVSEKPVLKWVHRVSPGPALKNGLPDFEGWMKDELESLIDPDSQRFPALRRWLASGMKQPYREVFRETFAHDLKKAYWKEGMLTSNVKLVNVGILALRYYQWTGDPKALDFFREVMWGMWDYLHSEDPQVYISDIDFRVGPLLNEWNWVEHDPQITAPERKTFTLLLLGLTRMTHDYYLKNWKDRRPDVAFNHITFKMRSLALGHRYFKRWNLPDLPEWEAEAAAVFGQIDPGRFKYLEDSGLYESFVPDHLLTWYGASGQAVPETFQQSLALIAKRNWAMTDNFFWPVEYGDANPMLSRIRPLQVAPWLLGETPEQQEIRLVERSGVGIFPPATPVRPYDCFTGLQHETEDHPFPDDFLKGWTRLPLDPTFARNYQASGSEAEQFDKLVWRSGWKGHSAYLALGGIGRGSRKPEVSHAHHEANSILRMNLGGRIWLVNNGYGRAEKALPSAVLQRMRQLGPEDHNTLVVREAASGKAMPPPMNARLIDYGETPVPYAVTELSGYGGVEWQRIIMVLPEAGFFVVDRMIATPGQDELPPIELQWNFLGERSGDASASRLKQGDVVLEFQHLGTATATWKESDIAAWRKAVRTGAYPHTSAPPLQCVLEPRSPRGTTAWFANACWLAGRVDSVDWEEDSLSLRIRTKEPMAKVVVERPWGRVESRNGELHCVFNPAPAPGAPRLKMEPLIGAAL